MHVDPHPVKKFWKWASIAFALMLFGIIVAVILMRGLAVLVRFVGVEQELTELLLG